MQSLSEKQIKNFNITMQGLNQILTGMLEDLTNLWEVLNPIIKDRGVYEISICR